MSDWMQRLQDAKRMCEAGLMTQQEFDALRRKIMAERGLDTIPPTSESPNPLDFSKNTRVDRNSFVSDPLSGAQDTVVGSVDPFLGDPLSGSQGTMVGAAGMDIGQYRILSLIGEGGMGSVYKARHKTERIAQMRGDVAIKIIKGEYVQNPQLRERFIQEAGLGMKIKHPNIADVIDFYEDNNQIAFIMEYIEGVELKEKIPSGGLSIEDTISYLKPIAEAVDYLHSQNIIHRDLKPANVKVKPDGMPVILDFGIAKYTSEQDAGMTRTGLAMGTQAYMAPEQLDAKNVDGRADQYALCMIAYEMLSGEFPWKSGESSARIGMRKLMGKLYPLHSVSPLSQAVSNVVMRGLLVDPKRRHPNCRTFVRQLEVALNKSQKDFSGLNAKLNVRKESGEIIGKKIRFVCGRCSAVYHVGIEKLKKEVNRTTCSKCGNRLEIRKPKSLTQHQIKEHPTVPVRSNKSASNSIVESKEEHQISEETWKTEELEVQKEERGSTQEDSFLKEGLRKEDWNGSIEMFDMLDKNGDGVLSSEELQELIALGKKSLGSSSTEQQATENQEEIHKEVETPKEETHISIFLRGEEGKSKTELELKQIEEREKEPKNPSEVESQKEGSTFFEVLPAKGSKATCLDYSSEELEKIHSSLEYKEGLHRVFSKLEKGTLTPRLFIDFLTSPFEKGGLGIKAGMTIHLKALYFFQRLCAIFVFFGSLSVLVFFNYFFLIDYPGFVVLIAIFLFGSVLFLYTEKRLLRSKIHTAYRQLLLTHPFFHDFPIYPSTESEQMEAWKKVISNFHPKQEGFNSLSLSHGGIFRRYEHFYCWAIFLQYGLALTAFRTWQLGPKIMNEEIFFPHTALSIVVLVGLVLACRNLKSSIAQISVVVAASIFAVTGFLWPQSAKSYAVLLLSSPYLLALLIPTLVFYRAERVV